MVTVSQAMRVAAFCFACKPNEVCEGSDALVLYTGDGWELPTALLQTWSGIDWKGNSPDIFITGPDNLLMDDDADKKLTAKDFSEWLIVSGMPREHIITEASIESQYTHGQAQSLIAAASQHGWRKVALFTSWYHAPRAWLTTIKRIPKSMNLLVQPYPTYGLSFSGRSESLEGALSAWQLLNYNTLTRLESYQEKGFCATFEEADAYLTAHGF